MVCITLVGRARLLGEGLKTVKHINAWLRENKLLVTLALRYTNCNHGTSRYRPFDSERMVWEVIICQLFQKNDQTL